MQEHDPKSPGWRLARRLAAQVLGQAARQSQLADRLEGEG
jgi:hypothetical protein